MSIDRLAIIGVGLIGSSLALSLKRTGYAKHIIGCSRSEATISKALELGVIDEGTTDPAKAATDADVIMLCTPLSTYSAITKAIAPALKEGAIITDAGSVKSQPTKDMLENLPAEHQPNLVPGHPIAGTEKSGPESGFAELYDDKRTILCPHDATDPHALSVVTQLWQAAGAKVLTLQAERHDKIYATVSHNIQLLCSAFMSICTPENSANTTPTFRAFIRLAGSNPIMWRDIALSNHLHIAAMLNETIQHLESIRNGLNEGAFESIANFIGHGQRKRALLKDINQEPPGEHNNDDALHGHMPALIAATILHTIHNDELDFSSGAGLHDMTRCLLASQPSTDSIAEQATTITPLLTHYIDTLTALHTTATSQDGSALERFLSDAQTRYLSIIDNA